MKDIFMSVFKTSEERLKNPFIGTFLLSFIALNWKAISIIFISTQTIENKIDYITKNYSKIENLLYYPLGISLIYIVILPYLMWLFESITFKSYKERSQNLYKNKIVDINGKKSVALSEIELENLKADFKEKSDLNNQINFLKNQIDDKDNILKSSEDRIENIINENNELKNELIKRDTIIDQLHYTINNNDSKFKNYYDDYKNSPKNTIRDFVNFFHKLNALDNNDKSNYLQDRFLSLGLVNVSINNITNQEHFFITEKGLYFIKRANEEEII